MNRYNYNHKQLIFQPILIKTSKSCIGQLLWEKKTNIGKPSNNGNECHVRYETSFWTRDNLFLLWWNKILSGHNSCPTIHTTSLVSLRQSFPKLWWLFLVVSPMSVMLCHLTSFNRVSGSIQTAMWSRCALWSSLGWNGWLLGHHVCSSKIQLPATPPGKVRSGCHNFYDLKVSPSNYTNCNSMDYCVAAFEKNTKAQLIDRIKESLESVLLDIAKAAGNRFQNRIEVVIDTEVSLKWIVFWLL